MSNMTLLLFLTVPVNDGLKATLGPSGGTPAPAGLVFNPAQGQTASGDPIAALTVATPAAAIGGSAPQSLDLIVQSADVPASLATTVSGQTRLDPTKVEDVVLVVDYTYGS